MKTPENLQLMLQKALVATLAGLLVLILLSALLIGGFVMLLSAMTLGLTPWVGEVSAYAITGFSCVLVLLLIFWGLMPRRSSQGDSTNGTSTHGPSAGTQAEGETGAPLDSFRQIIRDHPWDSVAASFALGYAQRSTDPRLKEILLESGLAYVRNGGAAAPAAEPGGPGRTGHPGTGPATEPEPPGRS